MKNLETQVKYLHYQSKGCPVVDETFGSLVRMLDVVLTKGFNINVILGSENLSDNHVKLLFNVGHGYVEEQVITVYGSIQEYFNKEFRVLEVYSDGVLIKIPDDVFLIEELEPSEELKAKTSPLGFTNIYTSADNNTMCFKNTSTKSPGILKVIDSLPPNGYGADWARYARVVMGLKIDDKGDFVNNQKAPFYSLYPDAEKTGNGVQGVGGIHGYAKWRYSITNDSYSRECYGTLYRGTKYWELIGDSNTFYLILNCGPDTSLLGFGNLKGDGFQTPLVLQAANSFRSSDDTSMYGQYGKSYNYWGLLSARTEGSFIMTDSGGNVSRDGLAYSGAGLTLGGGYADRPWKSTEVRNYNPFSGRILTGKLYAKDSRNNLRGYHRGLNILYGTDHPGAARLLGTDYRIINITDPYRDGIMPLMFTMKDWEEV